MLTADTFAWYVVIFIVSFAIGYSRVWWPLVRELYRHGLDNHLCHRDCCRFSE